MGSTLRGKMRATPEDPSVIADEGTTERPDVGEGDEEPDTEEEDEVEKNRYLRLRAKDFAKYGHSEECAGCARMKRGAKPPYRHNRECRRRLEKAIKRDDRARWERYEVRRPLDAPACSSSSESSDDDPDTAQTEAPEDDHGFPMISALVDRLMNVDVTEMCSPPRVTIQAQKFGLRAGDAWDLSTGWDFSNPRHREAAMKYVKEKKPLVVIGGPHVLLSVNSRR